jgi:aminoglycoside phosphotransferase (APT) family kinase protein
VSAQWTSTGAAALTLAERDGAASRIVTLVRSGAARLARETWVLAHLPPTARAPVRLETGEVGGVAFAVDELLPGHPSPDLLPAARTIRELHSQTARERVVDEELMARWVTTPLAVVEQLLARGPLPVPHDRLQRVGDQLRADLLGRAVTTSWVHGDFWSQNVLTVDAEVTGVIDWDLAAADELPSHDLLNLLIHARARATGRQLADLILSLLRAPDWSEEEREILGPSTLEERTALLLYWLRHVAAVGVQQLSYAQHSVIAWRLLNVHRLLRQV